MSVPLLPSLKESDVLSSVLDYLAAKRIFSMRMNTGAVKMGNRFVRFGVPGQADILAFPQELCDDGDWRPYILWIECKSPRGRGQSELQRSFQQQVEDQGHRYILATSIEDVDAALRELTQWV